MQHYLPVLKIDVQNIPCLLSLNGAIIGESSSLSPVPITPDGTVFLQAFPLQSDPSALFLPATVKLVVSSAQITEPLPRHAVAYCAPDGLIQLNLTLPIVPCREDFITPYALSRATFSAQNQTYIATLYYENGLRLAIEDRQGDRMLFLHAPEGITTGILRAQRCFGPFEDILLQGSGQAGPRFFLYHADGSGSFSLGLQADGIGSMEEEGLVVVCPVGDLAGHQRRTCYSYDGSAFIPSEPEYGFFTCDPRPLHSEEDTCIAFCQALKLGLFSECLSYLSEDLSSGLSLSDLEDFFGNFDHVYRCERPPYSSDIQLTLAAPSVENCFLLSHYLFEMHSGLIQNIHDA